MSVLETIRRKAGILIVIAIGASMVVFILEDALSSGRFFFGGNENTVAVVNGKSLDYTALSNKIQELDDLQKASQQTQALDSKTSDQVVQSAYQQMVTKMVLGPQCKKLGIVVSDSELTDLLLGQHPSPELIRFFSDPRTGHLDKQFIDPRTGGINMTTVLEFVKQISSHQDEQHYLASWTLLEDQVKAEQFQSKYFNLLRGGLFITDAQAKQDFANQNTYYNITYILKKYSSISDNTVQITDDDIQSYYNKHLYEYSQPEETRKIDYVTFDAAPTSKDLKDMQTKADSLASQFKKLSPSEDSSFIVTESEPHDQVSDQQLYDPNYYKSGQLDPSIDSLMTNSPKGFVYGPYKENNEFRIAKVLDVAQLPDSAKIAVIAIPAQNNDYTKAKALADSLKPLLTADNFATYAKKYSKASSADSGGNIGWLQQGKVSPEMERAIFFTNKGNIKEVQSQGAELLVLTEDQSPKEKYVKYGLVVKNIEPSQATLDSVYAVASTFAGKHATTPLFEQAANKINERIANFNENDHTIAGIESPKDMIRWAFKANAGDVSSVFDVGGNHYAVAHLVQISPMGTTPLAIVKDRVRQKVMQEKKAEKLITEMKSYMGNGANSISALGGKLQTSPQELQRLQFDTYSLPGLGKEDAVLGVMSGLKPHTLSQPIQGLLGVYVIQVDTVYSSADKGNYVMTLEQEQETLRGRVQYDAFSALKKKAGLVSHLGKFY